MFDLGKGKQGPFFEHGLEKDLKDEQKQKEHIKRVEKHIVDIKNAIRQGSDQSSFEALGALLHGYSALLKIFTEKSFMKRGISH